jgi:hypothetical protein
MKYVENLLHLSRYLFANSVYVCVCVCNIASNCFLFVTAGTTEDRNSCFRNSLQVTET